MIDYSPSPHKMLHMWRVAKAGLLISSDNESRIRGEVLQKLSQSVQAPRRAARLLMRGSRAYGPRAAR